MLQTPGADDVADGGFGAGEGFDDEGIATGEGEGGAWDVEDEDLELPPDLVRLPALWVVLCVLGEEGGGGAREGVNVGSVGVGEAERAAWNMESDFTLTW